MCLTRVMKKTRNLIKKAGGPAEVGRICNISSQAVSQWRVIPQNQCPVIEAATSLTCEEMRPDIKWIRDEAGAVIGVAVASTNTEN